MIILARSTNCIVHIFITEKITFKTNKTHKMEVQLHEDAL